MNGWPEVKRIPIPSWNVLPSIIECDMRPLVLEYYDVIGDGEGVLAAARRYVSEFASANWSHPSEIAFLGDGAITLVWGTKIRLRITGDELHPAEIFLFE